MKKKRRMYETTDKFLKALRIRVEKEFGGLGFASFDELNGVKAKEITKRLYETLKEFNKDWYRRIALSAMKCAMEQLDAGDIELYIDEDTFVDYLLDMYNGVTGYLYHPEAERKRLRLYEEIMTAREFRDRGMLAKAIKKSKMLWLKQSGQYAIDIEDEAIIEVWKRMGIKKVRWNTRQDERVCQECKRRDQKIYDINKVPIKPHYGDRCWFTPIKEGERTLNNTNSLEKAQITKNRQRSLKNAGGKE
ncbi:MAG: hypothetical protein Q4A41_05855 [Bacillota bacterium]|nr:hypothetical protein [Bacillota bacterium]